MGPPVTERVFCEHDTNKLAVWIWALWYQSRRDSFEPSIGDLYSPGMATNLTHHHNDRLSELTAGTPELLQGQHHSYIYS